MIHESGFVSIIIATYNSARTLPLVLASVRRQSYPDKYIEIIVIDGGSIDTTRAIARTYRCRVISNPRVEPVYAKYLGYLKAKGRYIMFIDHDEVMMNPDSISRRIRVFEEHSDLKAVTGSGYRTPRGYKIINRYINEFGDPFSFFMYRLSKHADHFTNTMYSRFTVVCDTDSHAVFDLSAASYMPLIELAAGGGMIDGDFFKKQFPKTLRQYELIPHLLYLLSRINPLIAIMKHDPLLHYSSDEVGGYMQKIIWRVKNNIFFPKTMGSAGYSGRQNFASSSFRLKKYLFLPYAYSFVLPLIDAIQLILTRRDISYIMHVPLTIISATLILLYTVLKLIGYTPALSSYDGSMTVYET